MSMAYQAEQQIPMQIDDSVGSILTRVTSSRVLQIV